MRQQRAIIFLAGLVLFLFFGAAALSVLAESLFGLTLPPFVKQIAAISLALLGGAVAAFGGLDDGRGDIRKRPVRA